MLIARFYSIIRMFICLLTFSHVLIWEEKTGFLKDDKKRFCTLKDVAKEAGVSYATISNYINRRELLNKKTADRVKKAINKLQYKPAVTARHLKMQKTNILGIIVPDIVNNFYATVTKTVEEVMRQHGFETIIYNTNYLEEEEEKALDFFISKRIRGLFLMSVKRDFPYLSSVIKNHKLPVVVIDNYVKGLGSWNVVHDNFRGAYEIINHLIEVHEYSDIAFISSNSKAVAVRERIKGYRKALEDRGLSFSKKYLAEGEFNPVHGYRAASGLLDMDKPPRAIAAATSMYTIGILKAIKEKGLRIPEDVAVTAFDDYDFAEVANPSITALERVDYRMGIKGAMIMLDILEGKKDIKKKTIRMYRPLIVRHSCGCNN